MTKAEFKNKLSIWQNRAFSWSQITSFDYSPEQWFKRYFMADEEFIETEEMRFGKIIGERLASDPKFLPEVPRLSKFEHPFNVMFGKIPLVGYADSFCDKTNKKLYEYKTGVKKWDQKRADEHGQIDMYLLMNYITNKIRPEEMQVKLVWLPTKRKEDGDFKVTIDFVDGMKPQIFSTKRTMQDILNFGARLNRVHKEMEDYAKSKI